VDLLVQQAPMVPAVPMAVTQEMAVMVGPQSLQELLVATEATAVMAVQLVTEATADMVATESPDSAVKTRKQGLASPA
jgi:hypothetical protein